MREPTCRRWADAPVVPWRNGAGVTREIAVGPTPDQGGFQWRVSMADVPADGPFSIFPGVDRNLTVVDGPGLQLTFDAEPVTLLPDQPFAFDGERECRSMLLDGPIRDVNVMTSRGHAVADVTIAGCGLFTPPADGLLAVVALGPAQVESTELGHLDSIWAAQNLNVVACSERGVLVIGLRSAGDNVLVAPLWP
jgi:uncharacterized protein